MSLSTIAANLISSVEAGIQPMRYKLERGLHLTLWLDSGDWRLSLSRYSVAPSEIELRTCRQAFNVPLDAAQETEQQQGWHIIRLRWAKPSARAEQPPLFDPPSPPPGHNYRRQK